ncbi:MAG: SpoIIE family protein phosphatase [Leptospiraceae bacterium]|nr:SpoIIE family protein phosphatase [Leptospiraceae bacterium]
MSIKYKIFLISGASQLLLLVALTVTSFVFINELKNEPQNKRAEEQSLIFQKELEHKDQKLKLLLSEILKNPISFSIIERGLKDRRVFHKNLPYLKQILVQYDLNIFEIGDKFGRVYFRVHRPGDFGDDKSSQPIIQSALKGNSVSCLEMGHSGLAFRVTAPFKNKGTILIGQVVDDKFTDKLSGNDNIQLAIFQNGKHLTSSSSMIKNYIQKSGKQIKNHSRITWEGKPYYITKVNYESKDLTNLKIEFLVMIDEKELSESTSRMWSSFFIVASLIFAGIFAVSNLFSRDITKAVKVLNDAMKNIDKNKEQSLELHRTDELGQMGDVFSEMKRDLYQYQNHLEELVNQKTLEIQNNLQEIKKIKEQQDGDYFLTSLLIKPLSEVCNISTNIKVDVLERQKKKFIFRNKEFEIGGDLCSIQGIELRNRRYTVFLNADAMGKSIQGAGGALVLGTVFKSILTRTGNLRAIQSLHPERWLKECFVELHNIFQSFDGSMFISAVVGLVDDETGTVYYINAEHPWVVLYRNKKANFIENELSLRKIGFTEMGNYPFYIKVFQLRPGDVIIVGSDGRDDIMIGSDGVERIINEDENAFLKRVEEGEGCVENIEKAILRVGEFTDDFSLLRIAFKENSGTSFNGYQSEEVKKLIQEGIKSFRKGNWKETMTKLESVLLIQENEPYALRELAKLYLKVKSFERAIVLAERYTDLKPQDTDFLYYMSYAYKQTKKYELAADFGEKYQLRDPANNRNLIQLAEIYIHIGNFSKARKYLDIVEQREQENKKVIRLKQFLEKKALVYS